MVIMLLLLLLLLFVKEEVFMNWGGREEKLLGFEFIVGEGEAMM